jgi:DNA primase
MAKISPVSIKYMIHAKFFAEGALEKPDVIGAIFGQTEGLLGSGLEMRDLQKEGKIGRIEVELRKDGKNTVGDIQIPTALDQSETTLIAAAIETIERIGPCDSQIEVQRIEDVRGSKRDYIIERAKKLLQGIEGSTDSREISNQIKTSARTSNIQEYGDEKLPAGDISGKAIIVVEGRADVINLLRNGIDNVIGMDGAKLPEAIKELGKEKELTLFVDGDRGGKLIAKNVYDNAKLQYITSAPDGKEVEELMGKEIHMALRKKLPAREFIRKFKINDFEEAEEKVFEISEKDRKKLKEISSKIEGSKKAILLNQTLEEIKTVSSGSLASSLKRTEISPSVIIVDGTVTSTILRAAEQAGSKAIVAKNFATTDTSLELLSL